MRVLVVSEGSSELGSVDSSGALVILSRRILGDDLEFETKKMSSSEVKIHRPHGQLPGFTKRILGWMRYARKHHYDALVLVGDEDGRPDRERQFSDAQCSGAVSIPRAVGLAIRSFDAWMLASPTGLQAVLPAHSPVVHPERLKDPKVVCLDLIASAARRDGLGAFYAEIAALGVISEMRTHCPRGFDPFADRLTDLRGQLAERSHA